MAAEIGDLFGYLQNEDRLEIISSSNPSSEIIRYILIWSSGAFRRVRVPLADVFLVCMMQFSYRV